MADKSDNELPEECAQNDPQPAIIFHHRPDKRQNGISHIIESIAMKLIRIIAFILLALAAQQASATILSVEFNWVPSSGESQYAASFDYSGGTTAGGVFTPTGLITYSIGTPFGISTPTTGPVLSWYTDTLFGPSFDVQGPIQPIDYQNNPIAAGNEVFKENNLTVYFQDSVETINYIQNQGDNETAFTGTWDEVITTSPDGGSSIVLLAVAMASLALFHTARRPKLAPAYKTVTR